MGVHSVPPPLSPLGEIPEGVGGDTPGGMPHRTRVYAWVHAPTHAPVQIPSTFSPGPPRNEPVSYFVTLARSKVFCVNAGQFLPRASGTLARKLNSEPILTL